MDLNDIQYREIDRFGFSVDLYVNIWFYVSCHSNSHANEVEIANAIE